ncbi:MAG: hypothetical protein CVU12_01400 [Bacteroidetes bacterium HGW-Bacteroidetes-7]|jgi:hypothetical protein|nr:MAG: hypothetical protein CVU12_01400 [Bacteroidetes bacterium HGW-Bacteroidetes-7]
MSIHPKFQPSDVRTRFDRFIEAIEKRQVLRLQYLGEMCVKHAREVPASIGFTDQTGNLRSSIGYMIFKNGVAIHEGFEQVGEGSEGVMAGQALAKRVGSKHTEGIALVVTAGMKYAIHLESKGRDVLTSAESLAKQELPKMVEELKKNIRKALTE